MRLRSPISPQVTFTVTPTMYKENKGGEVPQTETTRVSYRRKDVVYRHDDGHLTLAGRRQVTNRDTPTTIPVDQTLSAHTVKEGEIKETNSPKVPPKKSEQFQSMKRRNLWWV